MKFLQATILTAMTAMVTCNPLEIRNTDPSGTYPACAKAGQTAGKPFYLAATPYGSDPAYGAGYVQQGSDGQMFAGSSNGVDPPNQNCESATKPFFFFSPSGYLYDNHGRKVEVTSSASQVQANYGGGSTSFALCKDGTNELTYNGINTFYACQNGGTTSYRLYTGTQAPQSSNPNCNVIYPTASYL